MAQAACVQDVADLAGLLRALRRRQARHRAGSELTYRELAVRTGWSLGVIGKYFTGAALPPTERFDDLVRLLGATPSERGGLATARDRVEENRHRAPFPVATDTALPAMHRIPATFGGFTGRFTQLAELDRLVAAGRRAAVPTVVAVSGTAGVGKTATVVHWAHRAAGQFPGGQLYMNLRGFDPNRSPVRVEAAVQGFLNGLGVPPDRLPAGLEAHLSLYRHLLANRRCLVVLDNARDAGQVRPLLPGARGCVTVVTTRSQLSGLVASEGAHPFPLDLLTAAEARDLLRCRLGTPRVDAEPRAIDEIIARCAHLPLALAVASARAAAHPNFQLAVIADELKDSHERLDALASGDPDTDVRMAFWSSYRTLSADVAALFRLLARHSGPDIAAPEAAGLAGQPVGRARWLLAELSRASLLTEHRPGRYVLHGLLRAYAAELARTHHQESYRAAAAPAGGG